MHLKEEIRRRTRRGRRKKILTKKGGDLGVLKSRRRIFYHKSSLRCGYSQQVALIKKKNPYKRGGKFRTTKIGK